jgi:hypothetical protein
MIAPTSRLTALARLCANSAAQAEIAKALNVDDPSQQYVKRTPRNKRTSPEKRSVQLTAAEHRKLRPAKSFAGRGHHPV